MRSQFCLSSTASFRQINQASTNRSATKQTYSFSKTGRFQDPKPACPLNTYGSSFAGRKASASGIGVGERSDFTKDLTASPSAAKYKLKSFWKDNSERRKGAVFALGREKVSFNSYVPKNLAEVPSVVKYNNDKLHKTNAPKYTLRNKTAMSDKRMTIEAQNRNPGPGAYANPEQEALSQSRVASRFGNNQSYSQAKSRRFQPSSTITPGPGKYREARTTSREGKFVLSQHKGGSKAKFDSQRRLSMFDQVFKKELDNPGPGYYATPSQFGQYDGNIYDSMRRSKRAKNGWVDYQARKTHR